MKKHLLFTFINCLLISLTFVECKNASKSKGTTEDIEIAKLQGDFAEETPSSDDDSLYITAVPIMSDDFYRHPDYPYFPDTDPEREKILKLYVGEPDSIAMGVSEETNTSGVITHTVALLGAFNDNQEWLCIYLPGYPDVDYGSDEDAVLKTGITNGISEDWLGDSITLLKGFEEKCIHINIACKGYKEDDFEYLKQTEITDNDIIKSINNRISRGIKNCEFMRYKGDEKLRLRKLNCIMLDERTIYIANYKKDEEDVILLIENDKVKPLNQYYQFYSEVFFYKLRGTIYMLLEESVYAGHTQTIWKLDREKDNHYEAISSINKTTD